MTDMICKINYWLNDINMEYEVVKTIEDEICIKSNKNDKEQDNDFETDQLTREVLLELLKEEFGETVELINFEPVIDRDYDIYKLTY